MRDKCDECKSTNMFYDSALGELICNDCGLVMEESIMQEIEYEKREIHPTKRIKGYFNSGYEKDKKEKDYSLNPKVKEYLDEVYILENLLKEIVEEEWDNIKEKLMDLLDYNYGNDLPKTMEKRVLIWAILISQFEGEIIHLENQNKLSSTRRYTKALSALLTHDKSLYEKAESMRDKLLPKMAEFVNNRLNVGKGIEWETYVIDPLKVDPKSNNINKKGLYELFFKESMLIPHSEAGGEIIQREIDYWEKSVHDAAVAVARMFIQAHLIKYRKIGKKEGLLCACAYLICKESNLKPQPMEMWAQFFEISERCLKDRVNEIKNTSVPGTIQQPPLEIQIQNKEVLLSEKVQK